MLIETNNIFSMTETNQNFSAVAKRVDQTGQAIIFKNNKPKYVITDVESNGVLLTLTEDEKFEIVTKRVLKKYIRAFEELAK